MTEPFTLKATPARANDEHHVTKRARLGSVQRGRALLAAHALAVATAFAPSARAAPASIETATAAQSAAASEKYRAGAEAFAAQRFTDALARFHESYDLVASPNSHLMIGRTLAKLGKSADAYRELEATVREAELAAEKSDKYKKTAETARDELKDLSAKVATVVVNVAATVTVGDRPLSSSALGETVIVDPGKTEVVLRLPSGEEDRRELDLQPGSKVQVDLSPPIPKPVTTQVVVPCPPQLASPPAGINPRTLAIVTGAIGVAGFAAFGVFGALDQHRYSELERECPSGVCDASRASEVLSGHTYQTLANVGLGVGIAGAVSTIALLVVGSGSAAHSKVATTALRDINVGLGSVTMRGRF